MLRISGKQCKFLNSRNIKSLDSVSPIHVHDAHVQLSKTGPTSETLVSTDTCAKYAALNQLFTFKWHGQANYTQLMQTMLATLICKSSKTISYISVFQNSVINIIWNNCVYQIGIYRGVSTVACFIGTFCKMLTVTTFAIFYWFLWHLQKMRQRSVFCCLRGLKGL